MSSIIVTNNRYVYEKYREKREVIYKGDLNYLQVLEFVRDKIHEGHELLTHPLSGSVKPNETPIKTIMISRAKGDLDEDGLAILENSIETTRKFLANKPTPNWVESVLDDFRTIDLSIIENVIDKLGH
ncbi:MAG: GrdX family protein [Tissierellaceae bacterium]